MTITRIINGIETEITLSNDEMRQAAALCEAENIAQDMEYWITENNMPELTQDEKSVLYHIFTKVNNSDFSYWMNMEACYDYLTHNR